MSGAQWTTQVNHTLVELSRRVERLEALHLFETEARARQGVRSDIHQKVDGSSGQALEHAAERFDTNRQYVQDAKRFKERAPARRPCSWRTLLVVDRELGVALGRTGRGRRFLEVVVPRWWAADRATFPGWGWRLTWGRLRR